MCGSVDLALGVMGPISRGSAVLDTDASVQVRRQPATSRRAACTWLRYMKWPGNTRGRMKSTWGSVRGVLFKEVKCCGPEVLRL